MDEHGWLASPIRTRTFLFTDVEGSTRLWEEHPDAHRAFALHDRILRRAVEGAGGRVVKGTGDGVMAVFPAAEGAVRAALAIQRGLTGVAGELGEVGRVRVALHTGEAEERQGDYFGPSVNRCARLLEAGHGGQVLVSAATRPVLGDVLPEGAGLLDLGEHRLPDLDRPERIYQLVHPDLRRRFPRLRGVLGPRHNLPAPLSRFVGRKAELAVLEKLLRRARLVTLTGPGGSGKSRLAAEAARRRLGAHRDGVWLVELAPVGSQGLVAGEVARTLRVAEEPGREAIAALAAHLADRELLLLLDNCEHLLAACADLSERLLRSCPGLRILTTTREKLGVPGEAAYEVLPLSVPPRPDLSPGAVGRFDAVRLFVERAGLARPGFRLGRENAEQVVRICRHLDGLPLALELAAARLRVLSLADLADRIEDRFRILGGGGRGVLPRHQTLRATIDWSHELLEEAERVLLARLSVFPARFDLAAAEAVAGFAPLEAAGVLDLVAGLVDKSLVIHEEGRYRMLETVRQYAAERLEERGEAEELRRRHARRLAEGDDAALQPEDLRAALGWALEAADPGLALVLASRGWPVWWRRGYLREGREWLERVAEVAPGDPLSRELERVLHGAGDLAAVQGDLARARAHLERALAMARELDDVAEEAAVLGRLATLPHKEGDLAGATALFEEALVLARRAGDPRQLGHLLSSLALLMEDQGEHARAERLAAEAVGAAREAGDAYLAADALLSAGELALNRGDPEAARRHLEEALRTGETAEIGDAAAWARAYLGKLALLEGDPPTALRRLEGGLAEFRRLEIPAGEAWALRHLGWAAGEAGEVERAGSLLRAALAVALEAVRPDAPLVVEQAGLLAARRGRAEEALVLLGAGEALREKMGLGLPGWEEERRRVAWEAAAARVPAGEVERLTARGRGMSLEQAAEYVLARPA